MSLTDQLGFENSATKPNLPKLHNFTFEITELEIFNLLKFRSEDIMTSFTV